jgi:cytochrome c oxidase assembly factor CtaG
LVLAYAAPYALRLRTLRRRGRPVPAWRAWCFGAALVMLVVAVSPPFDELASSAFAWHMAEHLLIGDVAALLTVLGLSGPVLAPLLRVRVVYRLRVLAHPGMALALWVANLYLWHLPVAYEGALRHELVHAIQHACFFVFGLNLWMALVGPFPRPAWFGAAAQMGYVVVVRLSGAVLANVFVWSGTLFYPYYGGADALADQSAAGAVMMVEESVLTVGLFCWLFLKWARDAEERQRIIELAGARGIQLDERRIARAVAAGRGEELRRRVLGGAAGSTTRLTSKRR